MERLLDDNSLILLNSEVESGDAFERAVIEFLDSALTGEISKRLGFLSARGQILIPRDESLKYLGFVFPSDEVIRDVRVSQAIFGLSFTPQGARSQRWTRRGSLEIKVNATRAWGVCSPSRLDFCGGSWTVWMGCGN